MIEIGKLSRFELWLVWAVLVAGCSGARTRPGEVRLPFTVRLNPLQTPDPAAMDADAIHPPRVDEEEFTRALADALMDENVFTYVVTASDEWDRPVDLEMDVSIHGSDFGEGRATVDGAIFSTIAWLFVGYGAWYIDNRIYPDSNVILRFSLSAPGGAPDSQIFIDRLALKGMELSLSERARPEDWLLALLVPPWIGDGDREITGAALGRRIVEFFLQGGVGRIAQHLPGDHMKKLKCYLVHDSDEREIIIISEEKIAALQVLPDVASEKGARTFRGEDSLRDYKVDDVSDVLRKLTAREVLIGGEGEEFHFWRIGLEDASGYIRVEATLDNLTTARWTIFDEGPTDPATVADSVSRAE